MITFSLKKMRLKLSSVEQRQFCLGLNVFSDGQSICRHKTSICRHTQNVEVTLSYRKLNIGRDISVFWVILSKVKMGICILKAWHLCILQAVQQTVTIPILTVCCTGLKRYNIQLKSIFCGSCGTTNSQNQCSVAYVLYIYTQSATVSI